MTALVTCVEGAALQRLAAGVSAGQVIVEIGSYMGGSTVYLAAERGDAMPPAMVYAIDLWDMRLPDEGRGPRNKNRYDVRFDSAEAYDRFLATTDGMNVVPIKGDSREIAKAWSRPIGLLFIDGAHAVDSVTADYQGWAPWVRPGGYIAFHDAQPGSKVAGVIEEVVKPGPWMDWCTVDRLQIARRA